MGLVTDGYLKIPRLLHPSVTDLLFEYVLLKHSTGQMSVPDSQISTAPRLYADPLSESLLLTSQRHAEGLVGEELWPSYSYLRLHGYGDSLPTHVDRDASEIAVSVCVGGDAPWPLWLRTPDTEVAVDLEPGDGVIYFGQRLPHWREPFSGSMQIQCVLFYVRRAGPYGIHRFDGREGVGFLQQ